MADEVISFQFQFTGQDQFVSAMQQMASAAEQTVQKINAAFGQIKQPQAQAQAGEAQHRQAIQNIQQLHAETEKAGEGIRRVAERAGGFATAIGAGFGEGGKILGELTEKTLSLVGILGAGFASLGQSGYRVGRGLGEIGSGINKLESDIKGTVSQFGELKIAADGAKSAVGGVVSSAAVGAAGGAMAGPYGAAAGGIAGLVKGLLEGTVALGGALATVGVFGIEHGEKLRALKSGTPGLDIEGFRELQAVAEKTGSSLESFMGVVSRISEGIHDLSLTSKVTALQLQEMADRVQLVHDRLSLGAKERALQEHKASDEIVDSQHAIQQAHQSSADAQERYQDAIEEYERHGKPRTRQEELKHEEEQRTRNMLAAGRAAQEAQRNEAEAIHRQHDMIEQQKVQVEMRQQQTHMEQLLIERMERRDALEKSSLERTTDPTKRLFIDYNKYVGGVSDLAENMKKVSTQSADLEDKDPFEKWSQSLQMLQQIRSKAPTAEFERLSNLLGGGALGGADLRRQLDEYVKMSRESPEELRKLADQKGILTGGAMDTLADSKERFTTVMADITNSLSGISAKYNFAVNSLIDGANEAAKALMSLAQTGGGAKTITGETLPETMREFNRQNDRRAKENEGASKDLKDAAKDLKDAAKDLKGGKRAPLVETPDGGHGGAPGAGPLPEHSEPYVMSPQQAAGISQWEKMLDLLGGSDFGGAPIEDRRFGVPRYYGDFSNTMRGAGGGSRPFGFFGVGNEPVDLPPIGGMGEQGAPIGGDEESALAQYGRWQSSVGGPLVTAVPGYIDKLRAMFGLGSQADTTLGPIGPAGAPIGGLQDPALARVGRWQSSLHGPLVIATEALRQILRDQLRLPREFTDNINKASQGLENVAGASEMVTKAQTAQAQQQEVKTEGAPSSAGTTSGAGAGASAPASRPELPPIGGMGPAGAPIGGDEESALAQYGRWQSSVGGPLVVASPKYRMMLREKFGLPNYDGDGGGGGGGGGRGGGGTVPRTIPGEDDLPEKPRTRSDTGGGGGGGGGGSGGPVVGTLPRTRTMPGKQYNLPGQDLPVVGGYRQPSLAEVPQGPWIRASPGDVPELMRPGSLTTQYDWDLAHGKYGKPHRDKDGNWVAGNIVLWGSPQEIIRKTQRDQELSKKLRAPDPPGQQHGGMIDGPGTSTSDSILIRASAGEYIVRASAVNRLGRRFMDAINNGYADGGIIDRFATVPRYQFGGEVGRPTAAQALHPVTIALPSGEKITGFHGTADAVAALSKASVLAQASSTGRKPSWVR